MPRIVITGVAGLIGGAFARWVLKHVENAEVLGVDNLSSGYVENVPASVSWQRITLGEGDKRLDEAFAAFAPDYVFHFAAFAAEGLSPFVRMHTIRNTWLATAEVLNACLNRPPKRLVFTSSMAVYGRQPAPFEEGMARQPIDPYGVGKTACETDIEIAAEQHGLDYCIVRPHNVYGPGQNLWDDYRNVLGIWMRQRLEGKPLRIFGDGLQRRAFSYIDDCLPCLWRAAVEPRASRQIVNLGGKHPMTIRSAADMVRNVTGGGTIVYTEPRHEVADAWSTWAKSEDLLGYEERMCFFEGLGKMWHWAWRAWATYPNRRNPPLLKPEVAAGLYPWWGKE